MAENDIAARIAEAVMAARGNDASIPGDERMRRATEAVRAELAPLLAAVDAVLEDCAKADAQHNRKFKYEKRGTWFRLHYYPIYEREIDALRAARGPHA